jgi:hypothetical protein
MPSPLRLLAAALLLTAPLLAACQGPGGSTSHQAPGAAASAVAVSPLAAPTAAPRAVAVAVRGDTGPVRFLRPDGTELGRADISPMAGGLSAAGGRLWHLDSDGHLRAAGIDGSSLDMGVLQGLAPGGGASSNGLAVSPDGRSWAWGECAGCTGAGARARVLIGGVGAPVQVALDEPTTNAVLVPVAWTQRGIVVVRSRTGIGGCCYFWPEGAAEDTLLIDPTTRQVSQTLTGCHAAFASAVGSFACVAAPLTVHMADGSTRTVNPSPPVAGVGWSHTDDTGRRVVFGVIHSRGQGDGGCPCVIDMEAGAWDTGVVTKLADQMTPDDVLPDGRVVATSAPANPTGGSPSSLWLVSPDGARARLGGDGDDFVATVQL